MTDCADARTLLFVPGNRPARFESAVRSGADAVILDLEDSVPQTEKSAARGAVEAEWAKLMGFGVPLLVRINGGGSKESRSDVDLLTRLTGAAGVVCPKAESGAALTSLHDELGGVPLLPIVESAVGFTELASIAGSRGVVRFVVGSIDFMADTGLQCDDVESELAPLRFAVAMATRVHRLHAAIDGVTVQVTDDLKLRDDTRRALRFGFGGKLCIPRGKSASCMRRSLRASTNWTGRAA